jgi:glutamate dehydrogenase (NAD(P)+)
MPDALDLVDDWGPEKIVVVSNRRTHMKGVLVIDNTARGVGKGGTRMAPGVTVEEISRLARVMTWKWAASDLFHGGAKAGVAYSPAASDKETVLRSFVRALSNEVPKEYVFGLDMGLTEDDAAVIQDELGDRGTAVGTPYELGGIPYDKLGITGYGVAESAQAAAQVVGIDLNGARVVVQGFGAVGRAAAERLVEMGASVIAVSTAQGVLHVPDGIDVAKLAELSSSVGDACIGEYGSGSGLEPGEELLLGCEVLVPAALQGAIPAAVARRMDTRLVVEGANLPTNEESRQVLLDRGVAVVPDFIANAGGIVAAGFAMDARYSPFRPDTDQIFTLVSDKLRANTTAVLEASRAGGITSHQAALDMAQQRVHAAMAARGQWTTSVTDR